MLKGFERDSLKLDAKLAKVYEYSFLVTKTTTDLMHYESGDREIVQELKDLPFRLPYSQAHLKTLAPHMIPEHLQGSFLSTELA